MKIGIIGNCQASALARLFGRCPKVEVVAVCDVNGKGSEAFTASSFRISAKRDVDIVISQPMSDSFDELSTSRLRSNYGKKLLTFTNIYFTGLHPDITYLGEFGQRISSPLGDYHSRIILYAYLKGIPVNYVSKLFCAKIYDLFGYFNAYELSALELNSRDIDIDVQFSSSFLDITRVELPLFSINHPTSAALMALAELIAKTSGISLGGVTRDHWINPLNESVCWPIYSELKEALALSYGAGDLWFFPQPGFGNNCLTLDEFICRSYKVYDDFGSEKLKSFQYCKQLIQTELSL